MVDITRLFDYSALFSIALMAATIPTYAISVSFFGRESRRAAQNRAQESAKLSRRVIEITELAKSGDLGKALQRELQSSNKKITKLQQPVGRLSVASAVIYPLVLFGVALGSASFGLWYSNDPIGTQWATLSGLGSVSLNILGLFLLCRTLTTVNTMALLPQTLADFEVTFPDQTKTVKVLASQQSSIEFKIANVGSEVGEDVESVIWFPNTFKVLSQPDFAGTSPRRPGKMYVGFTELGNIQPGGSWRSITIVIMAPPQHDVYEVEFVVYEKKLGKTSHFLMFQAI